MSKFIMSNGKVSRLKTLPVTNCNDCGACCRHMGTPPGYAMFYPIDGVLPDYATESPDYERWKNLPPEIEAELREYYRAVEAGEHIDRTNDFLNAADIAKAIREGRMYYAGWELEKATRRPAIHCLWYDADTKRCKHYEHRPETCRDEVMIPGNDACLATRKAFRIPLPVA